MSRSTDKILIRDIKCMIPLTLDATMLVGHSRELCDRLETANSRITKLREALEQYRYVDTQAIMDGDDEEFPFHVALIALKADDEMRGEE